ncbi:hypothetical protein [Tolumonas lignilytica]|uniref:hypothetical protein n=1 Tax=Tolumonas lignilytica TaxID=1283284 RepID=UPI0004BA3F61|nr:hypothetical protein [Tolumonas lignilytica]
MSSVVGDVASIAGGILGMDSAQSAAQTQSDAATAAANATMSMYNQNRQDLSPYRTLGQNSINPLLSAMGYNTDSSGNITGTNSNNILQQKFSFDGSNLSNNPGYQFNLQQGLNGVNASAAARGLGVSGANIKGAESYAEGLSNQYYNDYYNQAKNTFDTNYNSAANNVNRLYNLVNMGQNSSAQTAQLGSNAQSTANNYLTSGAAATAAGTVGSTNSLTSAINNAVNYGNQANQVNNAYNTSSNSNNLLAAIF